MGKSWKKEKTFIPRNEEWGKFKTSNHGQGPHRKKSRGEHWLAELLEEQEPQDEEEDQRHHLSL